MVQVLGRPASDDASLTAAEEEPVTVRASGLAKRFGDLEAVCGVDFSVRGGELFAFLGPNGAGKSTTINMLCTLARPTGGTATVAGYDVARQPREVRARIGLVFQEQTLDDQLTARENLAFHAVLYRVPKAEVAGRIGRVLRMVGLADRADDLVSTFSGGMARRLEIARALLHTPEVLFLDEPTIGLDPQTRTLMWEDIQRLRREQRVTVFLTTHYMDEAEYADRIAIIDYGRIVALGSPQSLKGALGSDSVELRTADDGTALAHLREAGHRVEPTAEGLVVLVPDGESEVAAVVSRAGVPVRHVHVHQPTLDDVFLHFTGREIRDRPSEARATAMGRAWAARHR